MDILDRFSIDKAVVQAGMAEISRSSLASAVSRAGGLGTVGISPPALFEADVLDTIDQLNGETFSVNLLMPFVLRDHVSICIRNRVPIVTMFFGIDGALVRTLKENGILVVMQVGDVDEALLAVEVGVDALIFQGIEAGGHVRGEQALSKLLPVAREQFPKLPILAAGGIYDKATADRATGLGADGVVCGTRFLMSHESFAHDEYKQRLLQAEETVLTNLYGLGWPDKHRVLRNGATDKWTAHGRTPGWLKSLHKTSSFLAKSRADRRKIVSRQTLRYPFYTPSPMKPGMDSSRAEVTALYAGECVAEIDALVSAESIVHELAA